jgi:8-oxo-dGTP pyrophosphatase MutT (NUDIX family)
MTSESIKAPARLGSRTAYRNPWMSVREDTLVLADGSTGIYGIVDRDDYAVVIPEENGGFHLVEQFRHAVGRRSWEFPMGGWAAGKSGSPEELARRELLEETGLTAATWRRVGSRLHGSTGFCSQGFAVWHATGLTAGQPDREITEADMEQSFVTEDQFRRMIADGRIFDAPTITAYALLRLVASSAPVLSGGLASSPD